MSIWGCHCSYGYMGAQRRRVLISVCCDRWPWQWEAGREDGVKALLHELGPHLSARGESPLPDLHLFLEPKVILGSSQMFGLSLFWGQPDRFEYLWDQTQAAWRYTGRKKKKFHQTNILCAAACKLHMQQSFTDIQWWKRTNASL